MDFEELMKQALSLAKKGLGYTSPNPPVGALVVRDGQIVGAGYHRKAGGPHAEVEALRKAGSNAKGATLVTTLEPCAHFGKTPPCVDAIVSAGVKRVVGATADRNPLVSGRGYRRLRSAGVEVVNGVLSRAANEFYRPHFKFITTGMPFVTLKYAQSLDGRIATSAGQSRWISCKQSLKLAHRLRAENDAVVVGVGTLKKDNPRLTTRLVKGPNPVRIILSASGRIPRDRAVFTEDASGTIVATSRAAVGPNLPGAVRVLTVRPKGNELNLEDLLRKLGALGIARLLVEGGATVLTSFLKQKMADKIVVILAPAIIGEGICAIGDIGVRKLEKRVKLKGFKAATLGRDLVVSGQPTWN